MQSYEPATERDRLLEDRMAPAIARVLRPLLFSMEEQDVRIQNENTTIMDRVARAAWREFRMQCAKTER